MSIGLCRIIMLDGVEGAGAPCAPVLPGSSRRNVFLQCRQQPTRDEHGTDCSRRPIHETVEQAARGECAHSRYLI